VLYKIFVGFTQSKNKEAYKVETLLMWQQHNSLANMTKVWASQILAF
jgi:hypothetical protein